MARHDGPVTWAIVEDCLQAICDAIDLPQIATRMRLLARDLDAAGTLRHTCVQRLIDAQFPLKTIGDYVGHRRTSSTEIYTKVAIESLREVAMGDGEALL